MIFRTGQMRKRHIKEETYVIRTIDRKEIDKVIALQDIVYNQLLNKEVFFRDTAEDMIYDATHGGMIVGVFNPDKELVSYRYTSMPHQQERNLGRDIGLKTDDLNRVMHLESTIVHPDYRGNKFQALTLDVVRSVIKEREIDHLLCTISPYNRYSLYNIMNAGLDIKALKRKYISEDGKGLWRFILHKNLHERRGVGAESRIIRMDKIHEQKALILDGFIGDELNKHSSDITYSRFES